MQISDITKQGAFLFKNKGKYIALLIVLYLIIGAGFAVIGWLFMVDTLYPRWVMPVLAIVVISPAIWLKQKTIKDRNWWLNKRNKPITLETRIVVDDIFFYAKKIKVNFSRRRFIDASLAKINLSYFVIGNGKVWQVSFAAAEIFNQHNIGTGSVLDIKVCEENHQLIIVEAAIVSLVPLYKKEEGDATDVVVEKYWGIGPVSIDHTGHTKFALEIYDEHYFPETNFDGFSIEYSAENGLLDKTESAQNIHYTLRVDDRLVTVDWSSFKNLKIGDRMS